MAVWRIIAALGCGSIFGLGLAISGMMNPARVIGFLDVAGNWDPTLAFVMVGALLVAVPAYRLILGRGHPALAGGFSLPSKTRLDTPLILGSALFGVGWGLVGFCPGPAVTAVVTGPPRSSGSWPPCSPAWHYTPGSSASAPYARHRPTPPRTPAEERHQVSGFSRFAARLLGLNRNAAAYYA